MAEDRFDLMQQLRDVKQKQLDLYRKRHAALEAIVPEGASSPAEVDAAMVTVLQGEAELLEVEIRISEF